MAAGIGAVMAAGIGAQDLRVGAAFAGERADAIRRALAEAGDTIVRMPANFIRFPNSDEGVFAAERRRVRGSPTLTLDAATLLTFGAVSVPGHVWRAMQRLGAWIEPVLVAEWAEPVRDVRIARRGGLATRKQRAAALHLVGEVAHHLQLGRRLLPPLVGVAVRRSLEPPAFAP